MTVIIENPYIVFVIRNGKGFLYFLPYNLPNVGVRRNWKEKPL